MDDIQDSQDPAGEDLFVDELYLQIMKGKEYIFAKNCHDRLHNNIAHGDRKN